MEPMFTTCAHCGEMDCEIVEGVAPVLCVRCLEVPF